MKRAESHLALEPGAHDEPRVRGDCAAFVIEGGRVRTADGPPVEEQRDSSSAYWTSGPEPSCLVNIGAAPYRELAVELK